MKMYNQENDAVLFLLHFMIKCCLFVSVFLIFIFLKLPIWSLVTISMQLINSISGRSMEILEEEN